jgi:hypothetical protein
VAVRHDSRAGIAAHHRGRNRGPGQLVEDATAGDGIAVIDHPMAGFVAAHRSGWLSTVMRAVSAAGGPLVLAAATAAGGLPGLLRR